MYLPVTRRAYRQQVSRHFIEHALVSQVVNFGRRALTATLANMVGARHRFVALRSPKIRAEIPVIGSLSIE
jgi:hypothetical protein